MGRNSGRHFDAEFLCCGICLISPWHISLASHVRLILVIVATRAAYSTQAAVEGGNPTCWVEGFTYEICCDTHKGPKGNEGCWDSLFHTYDTCCLGSGGEDGTKDDVEALLAQGHRGDASVLPRLLQIAAEPIGCYDGDDMPQLKCQGTPRGLKASEWKKFFAAHAQTKLMRSDWPKEADPLHFYQRCCSGPDWLDVLREMEADCALGTAVIIFQSVGYHYRTYGRDAAVRQFKMANDVRQRNWGLQLFDCYWSQQVNHAAWSYYHWFLGPTTDGELMPCEANLKVYVDESPDTEFLRRDPLWCATRGLCFTEVWIHQYLRRSGCRVSALEEADFVYSPVYGACHGLDNPNDQEETILQQVIERMTEKANQSDVSRNLPMHLLLFTCEKWKLKGWEAARDRSVLAAVEAKPLQQSLTYTQHCQDCFRVGIDFVIPSACGSVDAARIKSFNREPKHRNLIVSFHGEHAETTTDARVAQGYLEVNETIRGDVIKHLGKQTNTSVGGPSPGYSFFMGTSHFCLIPRGRGFWTVRLYEAFYAGCIPVLLSDDYALPFEGWLDWTTFSLKWPMRKVADGLYEHLRDLVTQNWNVVAELHATVREVACWFDYHSPTDANCSPYVGLVRELESRARHRRLTKSRASVLGSETIQRPSDRLLRRYWF